MAIVRVEISACQPDRHTQRASFDHKGPFGVRVELERMGHDSETGSKSVTEGPRDLQLVVTDRRVPESGSELDTACQNCITHRPFDTLFNSIRSHLNFGKHPTPFFLYFSLSERLTFAGLIALINFHSISLPISHWKLIFVGLTFKSV